MSERWRFLDAEAAVEGEKGRDEEKTSFVFVSGVFLDSNIRFGFTERPIQEAGRS